MKNSEPLRIRRGEFVQTYFDTGAMGTTILYGVVKTAGPAMFTVEWESGLRNRVRQGDQLIKRAEDCETAAAAMKSLSEAHDWTRERHERPHDQHCAICDLAEFQGVTYASAHESYR